MFRGSKTDSEFSLIQVLLDGIVIGIGIGLLISGWWFGG